MKFPLINRISSLLQQVSLVHQFSLMQSEMETLAREEARFLEVTGNTISLLSALQENGLQAATVFTPDERFYA